MNWIGPFNFLKFHPMEIYAGIVRGNKQVVAQKGQFKIEGSDIYIILIELWMLRTICL